MTDQAPDTGELDLHPRVRRAARARLPLHARAGAPDPFLGPGRGEYAAGDIKVDARPGGVFETVMVNDADGSRYPTRAVYVEIVEPERIVWTEPDSGMTTTSTFRDLRRRAHRDPDPPGERALRDTAAPRRGQGSRRRSTALPHTSGS